MPENPKRLHRLIAERIQQHGPMSIAEYMGLALDTYYGTKVPFGIEGDFVTAPEISQMFGEMIGAWLVDVWLQMGKPEKFNLVELGPGRGTLMADILRTISAWPDFNMGATVHLVETSRRLRDVQAETLKKYDVTWHDNFNDVPEGACFVVANEFFDALPIHQLERVDGKWKERCVAYDEKKDIFYYTLTDQDAALVLEEQGNDGNIFEVSPAALSIAEEISRRISEQGGAALIIDYGYTAPGLGDTLQAVAKHQYSNPLENPGDKDITAHFDFGTCKAVAEQYVAVAGPVTQGQFLISLGIEERSHKLCEKANNKQRQRIIEDLCRLVAPREMGRLFKVMAFTQAIIQPAGFGEGPDEVSDNGS